MNDHPPERTRAGGTLAVHSQVPRARFRKHFLLACARHAAKHIAGEIGQINFVVVGDREMARLHRTYMNIRGTTDVLTFDLSERPARRVEGDVYICIDQARRQAAEYRVPIYHETARLAVHGVLHLAGYDDHSDTQRAKMKALEDRSLLAGESRA
jgi:probable rRNA maturation factor